jgi:hypothetical protein
VFLDYSGEDEDSVIKILNKIDELDKMKLIKLMKPYDKVTYREILKIKALKFKSYIGE